jgi:hypothetical protein
MLLVACCGGGCYSSGSTTLPVSRDTPMALVLPDMEEKPTVRGQRPETEGLPQTPPLSPPSGQVVPVTARKAPPMPGAPPDNRYRATVRAWVNGRPIFDQEVMSSYYADRKALTQIYSLPPDERSAALTKHFNQQLNKLIETELIYQDALAKIDKNARLLDKLKTAANKEFDKELGVMMRESKVKSLEQFRAVLAKFDLTLEGMRRDREKNFIAMEYMRTRIYPHVAKIGHKQIRDYYDQHQNEFRTVDKVKWQDVFIAVSPERPTLADARRHAEQLMARLQRGEGFEKLLPYDEGDSWKYRNGHGNGERRGEVKPPELEQYLFLMRDGEVGPLVEMSTGVHLFRLVKRDFAGQLPFDEQVQTRINAKLKSDVAEREYRRIIRELRERADVQIEAQAGER